MEKKYFTFPEKFIWGSMKPYCSLNCIEKVVMDGKSFKIILKIDIYISVEVSSSYGDKGFALFNYGEAIKQT